MRYPEGHREAVRASIVESAARALRREGLDGVSIPALMKEAGLTHGGFYGYFKNRDQLVAEAITWAAQQTAARVLSEGAGDLRAMLAEYLSEGHAKHPEVGCVLAALGTEGPKQSPPVRRAFAQVARGFVRLIDRQLRRKKATPEPSDEALRLSSQMVGAVVLARLVDDEALAKRLLAAARSA
ncbi:MAG TPA: TetR/AcrR family transcriptional regulator [Polyangiaceae bacterium]|nr:TetR/AcrR family transcriptional regulator [Polyangiaceae bacterium]